MRKIEKKSKKVVGSVILGAGILFGSSLGVFASETGFLEQVKTTLFGVNTQVSNVAANSVTKGNANQELNQYIDAETSRIANQLNSEYTTNVKNGNAAVAQHKEALKQKVTSLSNEVIADGKKKIEDKVTAKVTAENDAMDKAVDDKVKAELDAAHITVPAATPAQ